MVKNKTISNLSFFGAFITLIVISAGLFTFWREYIKNQINEGIN